MTNFEKYYFIPFVVFRIPKHSIKEIESSDNIDYIEPEFSLYYTIFHLKENKIELPKFFKLKNKIKLKLFNKEFEIYPEICIYKDILIFYFYFPINEIEENLEVILQTPIFIFNNEKVDTISLAEKILSKIFNKHLFHQIFSYNVLYILTPFPADKYINKIIEMKLSKNYLITDITKNTAVLVSDYFSIVLSSGEKIDKNIIFLYQFILYLYVKLISYEEFIFRLFPKVQEDIIATIESHPLKLFFSSRLKHVAAEISATRIMLTYELFLERVFNRFVCKTTYSRLYFSLLSIFNIEKIIEKIKDEISFLNEMYNVALSLHHEKQLYAVKILILILVILQIIMKIEGII